MTTYVSRQDFFTAVSALGLMDTLYQAVNADPNTAVWIEFNSADYVYAGDVLYLTAQTAFGWTSAQMALFFDSIVPSPTPSPSPSGSSAYTAYDQICGALRLLGVLAEGETPSSESADDALFALNQMIESWNIERLSVYCTIDQIMNWLPSTRNATLGPTGTLTPVDPLYTPVRPILLDDATYFRDPASGISYGIKLINQQQYDGIAVKTVTSTYPQVMFANPTYPNISLSVYPVPTKLLEFHFVSVSELYQPATLATTLAFPPGYLRAFRYNLACELAPEFGVEPSPQVSRIAMSSKRNLKRINNPNGVMAIPYSIVGTRQKYNIFAGNY